MYQSTEKKRIESKLEVQTYLDRLKFALSSDSVSVKFQKKRKVDDQRHTIHSNRYTIGCLFPDEDEIIALKRELSFLTSEDYIETVRDIRFPKRSEMRVFGKKYFGDDVYIKIRVELASLAAGGADYLFVMSFHFSEQKFSKDDFPYKKVQGET